MRVLIASTFVPFASEGDRMMVSGLERELRRRGVTVDTGWIPLESYAPDLPVQTLAIRLLELSDWVGGRVDRLITVRYPSYALSHPNKIVWFLHHHRPAYGLWGPSILWDNTISRLLES